MRPANGFKHGQFEGKMIFLQGTHDVQVWPGPAIAYSRLVRAHYGDATDDRYRLWWMHNAGHGAPEFIGPAVAAPAGDPDVIRHTGNVLVAASLAMEYGFTDIDGKAPRPLSLADV